MADFCRRLRDARKAAGLSIEEISARTKINAALLTALETGDFARLPGEFYTRAFLKTFAREVGLPADEVGRDYDAIAHPPELSPVPVHQQRPTASVNQGVSVALHPILTRLPRDTDTWVKAAFAIFLVIVAGFVVRQLRTAPGGEPGAVGTSGVVQAAPAPAATTGQTAAPEKLTIEIRPTAPIWVAATADGNSAIYRLLKPGEQVVVEARNELSFRIGNAAAFAYTVNGVPGKPLGGPDEVREFDITRDNYLSFRR